MAQLTVDSQPTQLENLNRGVAIIQNLGPGDVFMDSDDSVSTESGFKIAAGGVYETLGSGGGRTIFLVSDSSAEVRYVSI